MSGWIWRSLFVAALLAGIALGLPARAQKVTWEAMPLVEPVFFGQRVTAVGLLRAEGAAAANPALDSLVIFQDNGVFLYNPSGAAGAAGANGEYGAWHLLCGSGCGGAVDGLVTASGSLLGTSLRISHGTRRGRRWTSDDFGRGPLLEATLPALAPPGQPPTLLYGSTAQEGNTLRSTADGAPGTWTPGGLADGHVETFGEVPPSPALPQGRLLAGVWNGAVYSDDGGTTWRPSNAFGLAAYVVYSFAFVPQAGHPYGGVAYGGFENVALYPDGGPRAEVHRSDDGGTTWTLVHRFTVAETGQPADNGNEINRTELLATADGALWAGVSLTNGTAIPFRGGVMRSVDGGATWQRADAGFGGAAGRGYQVYQLKLSRTGVLYAATDRGVWRTTGRAVVGEAVPDVQAPEVGVTVRPNPARGRTEVVLSLTEASLVRVVVVDALGREVAVVLDGAAPAGERVVGVDLASWPAGVYVVRAMSGGRVATARLVVAR